MEYLGHSIPKIILIAPKALSEASLAVHAAYMLLLAAVQKSS